MDKKDTTHWGYRDFEINDVAASTGVYGVLVSDGLNGFAPFPDCLSAAQANIEALMPGDDDWTKGNRERDALYAKQRLHGANIDGGTESANIPVEDFGSWAHGKIKAASDAFDSESALDVSNQWQNLATGFKSALDNFKSSLDTAINGSWTGEGAEAAKQAISDYKSHAEKVSDGMSLMATKPAEVETAMTQIKGLMPEVV
ncbi:PPE domain-containing protein, partial [Aduncisulcus paluster]